MSYAPGGRDTVGHPELVDVFPLWSLGAAARVGVHVDEARHHVVARQIDFAVGATGASAPGDRDAGETDRPNLGDAITFDDDVHRPLWWSTGPIDDRSAPENEAVEGPLTLIGATGRRRLRLS